MRKMAEARRADADFQRAMIFDPEDGAGGVYLFLFRSMTDGPCDADYFYLDVAGAERHAAEVAGIEAEDWQSIPNPPPGCQDDWVAPTRVVRDSGRPGFGRFECA